MSGKQAKKKRTADGGSSVLARAQPHNGDSPFIPSVSTDGKVTFNIRVPTLPRPDNEYFASGIKICHVAHQVILEFSQIDLMISPPTALSSVQIVYTEDTFAQMAQRATGDFLADLEKHLEQRKTEVGPLAGYEPAPGQKKLQDAASFEIAGRAGDAAEIRFYRLSPVDMSRSGHAGVQEHGSPELPRVVPVVTINLSAHLLCQLFREVKMLSASGLTGRPQ